MHISTLKNCIQSLNDKFARTQFTDLFDHSSQTRLTDVLKKEGLFVQVDKYVL